MTCEQCELEFDRITDAHTTKEHLQDNLSDLFESYKRVDYHEGKSEFRDDIEKQIKDLETKIKELEN